MLFMALVFHAHPPYGCTIEISLNGVIAKEKKLTCNHTLITVKETKFRIQYTMLQGNIDERKKIMKVKAEHLSDRRLLNCPYTLK